VDIRAVALAPIPVGTEVLADSSLDRMLALGASPQMAGRTCLQLSCLLEEPVAVAVVLASRQQTSLERSVVVVA